MALSRDKSKINQDKNTYGMEQIVDLEDVPDEMFQEGKVKEFLLGLCKEIKMNHDPRGPLTWGCRSDMDDPVNPKSDGISGVLFIETSSITIHAIDRLSKVFVNCFSCADFDPLAMMKYTEKFWKGKIVNHRHITRV
jgi:S-adenosylmethionine/arginine decarboxylase-like enzyme